MLYGRAHQPVVGTLTLIRLPNQALSLDAVARSGELQLQDAPIRPLFAAVWGHFRTVGEPKLEEQMAKDFSGLERPRYPMPEFVRAALAERGLMADYEARPAYQQNDYIGWITRAKRPETQLRRLAQMLDELAQGGVYMKMKHPASAKGGG